MEKNIKCDNRNCRNNQLGECTLQYSTNECDAYTTLRLAISGTTKCQFSECNYNTLGHCISFPTDPKNCPMGGENDKLKIEV